jgi:hypothetical protein
MKATTAGTEPFNEEEIHNLYVKLLKETKSLKIYLDKYKNRPTDTTDIDGFCIIFYY